MPVHVAFSMNSEDEVKTRLENLVSRREMINREINIIGNGEFNISPNHYHADLMRTEAEIANYASQAKDHGFGYMEIVRKCLKTYN